MLFNWKLKILSSIIAVAMLFTMCPSTTFAEKTWLHEILENKNHIPSVDELKHIVDMHPEWLNEKDDKGRTPLDIARENDLSNAIALLTVSTPLRDDQLSDFFTSFSHVPVKMAVLEAQTEELTIQMTEAAKTASQVVESSKKIAAIEPQIEELKRNQLAVEERLASVEKIAELTAVEVAKVRTGPQAIEPGTVLSLVYPIGSIYMSINSTDPSTLFGGKWVRWGNGRVPIGIDSADTDFSTSEKTGGEKSHTLTLGELPATTCVGSSEGYGFDASVYRGNCWLNNNGGRNQPHNNLPPYITCYMWKRIA